MSLKLAPAVRKTVAGRRLGALEEQEGTSPRHKDDYPPVTGKVCGPNRLPGDRRCVDRDSVPRCMKQTAMNTPRLACPKLCTMVERDRHQRSNEKKTNSSNSRQKIMTKIQKIATPTVPLARATLKSRTLTETAPTGGGGGVLAQGLGGWYRGGGVFIKDKIGHGSKICRNNTYRCSDKGVALASGGGGRGCKPHHETKSSTSSGHSAQYQPPAKHHTNRYSWDSQP